MSSARFWTNFALAKFCSNRDWSCEFTGVYRGGKPVFRVRESFLRRVQRESGTITIRVPESYTRAA